MEITQIDETDGAILNFLRENGRATFASIGIAVGLSPHGAADRVRRLERKGVITGYSTNVNYSMVGRPVHALINVRLLPSTDPKAFEDHVVGLPAVRRVVFVTGRFDFQVLVACRDADDLGQTVRSIRKNAGAAGTETSIVMRSTEFYRVSSPEAE